MYVEKNYLNPFTAKKEMRIPTTYITWLSIALSLTSD